jgi:peptide/nickel transport system permease protein
MAIQAEIGGAIRPEPLWRVRLRLIRRSLSTHWGQFAESPIGLVGLAIIIFFALLAISEPILSHTIWSRAIYDPQVGYDYALTGLNPAPPSATHWLGTDPNGRDIFSQLAYSARSEFLLGILAGLITVFIGTLVGAAAAYYGGFVDTFFMRVADVFLLFPVIAFFIVLSALFGSAFTIWKFAIILGLLVGFGGITIVLKSQALNIKVKPFVDAARISGGSSFHIIFSHIIPNLLPLSFLYMMFSVTTAIFSEAVLSFFGIINLRMSWGIMVEMANINGYLNGDGMIRAWWLFFPASLSITALCAAFYLVGRGMDEIVNPRLRRR